MKTAYFINAFFEVDKVDAESDSARELRRAGNLFLTLGKAKKVLRAIHDAIHDEPFEENPDNNHHTNTNG